MTVTSSLLRQLPSIDRLLTALGRGPGLPRAVVVRHVRQTVERQRVAAEGGTAPPTLEATLDSLRADLAILARSRIQPVINGTGVLIHTNLGRSPLAASVAAHLGSVATQFNNLEFDLESGERGQRGSFAEYALATLCETPAATITNNCAAALILMLRQAVADGRREVIIARSQLIEIGGGFRVPEIMETSGAKLREVGATNKVRLADYAKAITAETAAILIVHRSNFAMTGFIGEPDTAELVALGREHNLPVLHDLGSGAMVPTERLASVEHEPTPIEIARTGVALTCFSGDKLCGGPQSGLIIGDATRIAAIKRDPIFRALRCDRLALTALQETLAIYLDDPSAASLPLLTMLSADVADLQTRAEAIVRAIGSPHVTIGAGTSRCGGGTMPLSAIPSVTLDIAPHRTSLEALATSLRQQTPPVVGYTAQSAIKLDLRTIFGHQDALVIDALRSGLGL
jgi:L-seryl-tRNA(Ser) seleniumtransferase